MDLQKRVKEYLDGIVRLIGGYNPTKKINFILVEDNENIDVFLDMKEGKASQWGHISKKSGHMWNHAVTGPKKILEAREYDDLLFNGSLVKSSDGENFTYKYVNY